MTIEDDKGGQKIVAHGQVEINNGTEVIYVHGTPLPHGYRRVTVTEDIVPAAPLPCPNDELVAVCQVKNSYTTWPNHLIIPRKVLNFLTVKLFIYILLVNGYINLMIFFIC